MRPWLGPAGDVGREEGRRRALEELSNPVYGQDEPGLLDRVVGWVMELVERLIAAGADTVPGGWWILGPLLLVLVALLVWLTVYLKPSRGRGRGAVVDTAAVLTAADHRAAADRHEADGRYAEAVVERLRAISRDLEERALIDPRPGRTATELADETSAALPAHQEALDRAARIFNDTVYGERSATREGVHELRVLDERLRQSRPAAQDPAPARSGAVGEEPR